MIFLKPALINCLKALFVFMMPYLKKIINTSKEPIQLKAPSFSFFLLILPDSKNSHTGTYSTV